MRKLAFAGTVLLLGLTPALTPAWGAAVTEWRFSQSAADNFEHGEASEDGGRVDVMRPWLPNPDGYAALTRSLAASDFRGHRIRLAGKLRTEEAQKVEIVVSAVSGAQADIARLAVGDGRTAGTMDWRGYELVVDVPDGAARLVIGVQTTGKGTVWVRDFSLEVVNGNVAVTASASPWHLPQRRPMNTNFDQ